MSLATAGLLFATPTWAVPINDTEIIFTSSDAHQIDTLGQAIAIDGNIAIAGVDRDDDAGPASGSAYIFNATTGAELFKLTASDAEAEDVFGHSVEVSGNTALVGAFSKDDAVVGADAGAAYLFDVTTGKELFKLTASDGAAGDRFGHGIDISGSRAIVGSYHDDDLGHSSGSAYIFDVFTGNELMKLTASDGAAGDQFGYWVALDGNIAIVGSKYDNHAGYRSGSAYVFDVTTGEELFKLTASDAGFNDEFGYAVAIEGNMALVGAWRNNDAGNDSGSVYVFDVTTGNELMKLTASDAQAGDYFGYTMGISNNTIVVGAYGEDDMGHNSGSIYFYDLTFGDELAKVTASDGSSGDEFGTAVAISGDVAVSGALFAGNASGPYVGQAYLYNVSSVLPPGADFNEDGIVDSADLLVWENSVLAPRLDINEDLQVDGTDFLLWQRSFQDEIVLDESPANLDQQGPVDSTDLLIWEQAFGTDVAGDLDSDGDTDGADFLELQREFTPFDIADENKDYLVDDFELDLWKSSFGWDADTDGDGLLDGDADGDGLVTERDRLWWQKHAISEASLAASTQIPEPASGLLLSGFLVACLVGRRPRFLLPVVRKLERCSQQPSCAYRQQEMRTSKWHVLLHLSQAYWFRRVATHDRRLGYIFGHDRTTCH